MANPQKENGYTAIANEIMEALCQTRIPGEARQMLDVIIRKTYGYGKKSDEISTSQFMQLTQLPNFTIHKARKRLLDMNLITVTKKGNSQILSYSFQKDYTHWKVLPKKVTVTKKGSYCNQKRSQSVAQKAIHNNNKVDITITRFRFLSDKRFEDVFNSYLISRKKKATDHAKELILKDLHKYDLGIAVAMLEQSIKNGWQGIFPLKNEVKKVIEISKALDTRPEWMKEAMKVGTKQEGKV